MNICYKIAIHNVRIGFDIRRETRQKIQDKMTGKDKVEQIKIKKNK